MKTGKKKSGSGIGRKVGVQQPEHSSRISCPECKSTRVLFEVCAGNKVQYLRWNMKGQSVGSRSKGGPYRELPTLSCKKCGHVWDAPDWVEDALPLNPVAPYCKSVVYMFAKGNRVQVKGVGGLTGQEGTVVGNYQDGELVHVLLDGYSEEKVFFQNEIVRCDTPRVKAEAYGDTHVGYKSKSEWLFEIGDTIAFEGFGTATVLDRRLNGCGTREYKRSAWSTSPSRTLAWVCEETAQEAWRKVTPAEEES